MITQKELKRLLRYDPESGVFTWRVKKGARALKGSVAGTLHPLRYIHINIDRKQYKAHRLAWLYVYGKWPENQIDHINHIRNDNRIKNLRDVKRIYNGRNQKLHNTNKTGVSGVYEYRQGWCAAIRVKDKLIYLGYFLTFEEAVAARKAAEKKYGFHDNHGLSDETMEMLYGE